MAPIPIVIDVETSGLNYRVHSIVEIGAVFLDGDQFEEIEMIINPGLEDTNHADEVLGPNWAEALDINGLTLDDIISGEEPGEAVEQFFDRLPEEREFYAYNRDMERRFLMVSPWYVPWKDGWGECLMEWTMAAYGRDLPTNLDGSSKRPKLGEALAAVGIQESDLPALSRGPHSALWDAMAEYRLMQRLDRY